MTEEKKKGEHATCVLLMCHRFVSIWFPTTGERLIHLFMCAYVFMCVCVVRLQMSSVLKGCDSVDIAGGPVLFKRNVLSFRLQ